MSFARAWRTRWKSSSRKTTKTLRPCSLPPSKTNPTSCPTHRLRLKKSNRRTFWKMSNRFRRRPNLKWKLRESLTAHRRCRKLATRTNRLRRNLPTNHQREVLRKSQGQSDLDDLRGVPGIVHHTDTVARPFQDDSDLDLPFTDVEVRRRHFPDEDESDLLIAGRDRDRIRLRQQESSSREVRRRPKTKTIPGTLHRLVKSEKSVAAITTRKDFA